jgi:outer membrane lipoprotein SlyB
MTTPSQPQATTPPGATSGPNKTSLVIGALGLVAIGALGAVLLLGNRAPPAVPVPTALVEAASAPALVAEAAPSAPAAVALTEAPAPVVTAAAPPAKPAHKSGTQARVPANDPQPTAQAPSVDTAPAPVVAAEPPPPPVKVICARCGVVTSVTPIEHKGEGSGLGAVAGGVLGGILGHQAGGGRGKDAMTVLGAIGGGLAGNEVEKRKNTVSEFQLHIRMDDGSRRTFTRTQAMAVGQRVLVEGERLDIDTQPAGSR